VSIDPAVKKSHQLTSCKNGETLTLEPVIRGKRRLGLKDFDPCTILLNNDLVTGVPGILEEIFEQYLLPPLQAGWPTRRMSSHYKAYEEVAKRLGKTHGCGPLADQPAV
jgi:glutamate--cysteine ligase